jgi:hypothetical protein
MSLAERYEAGDHRAVWEELSALGPGVYEPEWRADAEDVAAITMQRAATNVATLIVRLTLMGYRFGHRYNRNQRRRTIEDLGLRDSMASAGRDVSWVDAGDVEEHVMGWQSPADDVLATLEQIEKVTGALPLSLRAFVRYVDAVDLSGSFPSWDPSAYAFDDGEWPRFGTISDPLNFNGAELINEFVRADPGFMDPMRIPAPRSRTVPVASNHLLSANQAGDLHTILLPDRIADPIVLGVYGRPDVRLVEYLRAAFEWGGFPGFAFAATVPPEIDKLRRGLLPI